MNHVRLSLEKVKRSAGDIAEFEFRECVKELELKGEKLRFTGPLEVRGQVENLGNRIFHVEGTVKASIQDLCYRCLAETQVNLNVDFSLKFSERPVDPEAEGEDFILFTGDEIDLKPYIINEIILNWPARVLCRPDCKGLCPRCGTNLNITTCNCGGEGLDPRMAVLEQLLKKD